MSNNWLIGALSAFIIKQRTQNTNTALAGGALSLMTPGILSLAIPLVIPVPSTAKGGTTAGGGTTATPPPVLVALKDFVTMDKDAAEAAAVAQKMKVTLSPVVVESAAGKAPAVNTVVKQVPDAGVLTALGTRVHLFYAVAATKSSPAKLLPQPQAK
jgi:hypothetical protein